MINRSYFRAPARIVDVKTRCAVQRDAALALSLDLVEDLDDCIAFAPRIAPGSCDQPSGPFAAGGSNSGTPSGL